MVSFFKSHAKQFRFLALLFVLAIASYLRLYKISGYMTFLGDEGRDVLVVKRMIVDHKFTLLGPTASVGGFFMGPVYYYFMAPFLWLFKLDPTGPAVMVALFGIATVYLVYRVGKDFFNEKVGLIASFLYALSPITIAYSRSSWNPNIVPFFAIIVIYFLWRVIARNEWKYLLWVGIALGIGLQLHYIFIFLIFTAIIWFCMLGRSIKHIHFYVLGVIGFLLGYSLFLAFEIRHGFPNTQSIIRFVLEGKGTGFSYVTFFHTVTEVVFRLFGRLVLRLPEGVAWGNYPRWIITSWITSTNLFIVISLLLVSFILYTYISRKKWTFIRLSVSREVYLGCLLLLVWLIVPLVFFGLYQKAIYDYYFGILYPLPFLYVGIIVWVISKIKYGYIVAGIICISLIYLNWQGRPFLYPPNNQLAQTKRIAATAFEKAEGKPYNFALIADRNSDHAFRYFFEIWGNPPVTILPVDQDRERKTVTSQLIVMCDNLTCQPLGHPLWEIAGFGRSEIVGSWDVPFVRIYKLIHYKEGV